MMDVQNCVAKIWIKGWQILIQLATIMMILLRPKIWGRTKTQKYFYVKTLDILVSAFFYSWPHLCWCSSNRIVLEINCGGKKKALNNIVSGSWKSRCSNLLTGQIFGSKVVKVINDFVRTRLEMRDS
jgi:hypothetical protein